MKPIFRFGKTCLISLSYSAVLALTKVSVLMIPRLCSFSSNSNCGFTYVRICEASFEYGSNNNGNSAVGIEYCFQVTQVLNSDHLIWLVLLYQILTLCCTPCPDFLLLFDKNRLTNRAHSFLVYSGYVEITRGE